MPESETHIYDFIIVGQGIAGSMLVYFLLQQNKKVLVIDKSNPNSSSNIAAGVVNPITGRKMVKSWMIDEFLPFAKSIYKTLEKELNVSFFYEQDIYKIFTSAEDIEIWNRKKCDPEYVNYLGDIISDLGENINTPFGTGIIKQSCWMDVPVFIKAYRNFLRENNMLIEESFETDKLEIRKKIHYKNFIADKLIFCEGYKAFENPYFNFIEFSLAKGEQFTIYSPELRNNKMLNKNIFILPKKDNFYSVGSTFLWDDLDENVTETGRNEIINKLNRIINCTYEITEEKAGIRPAIVDRRPVLGSHPDFSNLFIFNGLGTKGVTLAPFFAKHLVNHMLFNDLILNEVALLRFNFKK
jgi:glycine/D-amino acid oxidase-like deaminating enzyme